MEDKVPSTPASPATPVPPSQPVGATDPVQNGSAQGAAVLKGAMAGLQQMAQKTVAQAQVAATQLPQAGQQMVQPQANQPKVGSDERLWGAISYIPFLGALALLVKPQSNYIRLHGRQGLLIFALFFCSIFLYIIFPPLGAVFGGLIQMALFVIGIYSTYQAFIGNWWKIPFLGDIAERIPVEFFTKVATEAITGQTPVQPTEMAEAPSASNVQKVSTAPIAEQPSSSPAQNTPPQS